MTEQSGADKYIKCSRCKCKYINDYDNIKTNFDYNRLNLRFKTCVKCRTKTVKVKDDKEQTRIITVKDDTEQTPIINLKDDTEAYEMLFKTLNITSKNIKRDIMFDVDDLIIRYGNDGYGDKPKNMNRVTCWLQHLDLTDYLT